PRRARHAGVRGARRVPQPRPRPPPRRPVRRRRAAPRPGRVALAAMGPTRAGGRDYRGGVVREPVRLETLPAEGLSWTPRRRSDAGPGRGAAPPTETAAGGLPGPGRGAPRSGGRPSAGRGERWIGLGWLAGGVEDLRAGGLTRDHQRPREVAVVFEES